MRTIKFRGQRTDNKEWVYGYYRAIDNASYIFEDGVYGAIEVIPESVGQWTGLCDRYNIEIFEGDIVQLYRYDNFKNYTFKYEKSQVWANGENHDDIKEVKFMYGSFVIWSDTIKDYRCYANLARPGEQLEIIGSIHTHPELLKEKA